MAQTSYSVNISDGNTYSGNTTCSWDSGIYMGTGVDMSDEDVQIMRWLSPLEPSNRHQGVRTNRFCGIGDWFLETREFREWRGGEGGSNDAVLFCSGNLGVGKTYLK